MVPVHLGCPELSTYKGPPEKKWAQKIARLTVVRRDLGQFLGFQRVFARFQSEIKAWNLWKAREISIAPWTLVGKEDDPAS